MAIYFLMPNGQYLSKTALSTTVESRFITGTYDEENTVDLEVSVRGKAFVSSPDLISFTKGGFVVPNPEAYIGGLDLFPGDNTVIVRATNLKGQHSDLGEINLILVGPDTLREPPPPPSGVRVESYQAFVRVLVEGPEDRTGLLGYNFYCSTVSGGGDAGYTKINLNLVTLPEVNRYGTELASMDVDMEVTRDEDGNLLKSPQVLQIIAQQADFGTQEVISREVDEVMVVDDLMDKLRLQMKVEKYTRTNNYSFAHSRTGGPNNTPATISNNDFLATEDADPLYYVATSVYMDPNGVEYESAYSVEVEAKPQPVLAQSGLIPTVTKEMLLSDVAANIYLANPDVSFHPGTILRDVIVDPYISEAQRIRMLVDFLHRSSSFHTLLEIDDPFGVGSSIQASESPYKTALANAFHFGSPEAVQPLIDGCFDKMAANYGVARRSGLKARGEATFYTSEVLTTLFIPLGSRVKGGSTTFLTTSSASIPYEDASSYYDPTTKRYSVKVGVVALNTGEGGNLNSGELSTTPIQGLSVTNDAPTYGGASGESNGVLANRTLVKIASIDTGTKRGYYQAVASIAGVQEALCVAAGDDLMRRDFDPDYNKHLGGKVDVWVRGTTDTNIADTFAFTFETKQDVQFELVHLDSLTFRVLDDNLSLENPLMEMLNYEVPKLGLVNASTGEYFDLTDVEISSYNVITLSTDIDQPSVDFGDVVLGDYRYRTGSAYVFGRQPVSDILSMTGTVAGELDPSVYTLTRATPPTTLGFSAEAGDYVQVTAPVEASEDVVVPTGELIEVEDESHVLVGEYIEYLSNLGGINLTIKVTSEDGATEYRGPYDPSGVFDYTIIEGDQTTPIAIKRIEGQEIGDGDTVLISYKHDENFTVKYTSNLIVATTQETIDGMKHLAADVLIKESIPIQVDISATVVTTRGQAASTVDASVRYSLATLFAGLQMGDPIRQSDVVEAIDSAAGVSYVVLPMTKMTLSDGSYVIQESLASDQAGDHSLLLDWSTGGASVFLLHETLNHTTTVGGGAEYGVYRMIEKDGFSTDLIDVFPQLIGGQVDQSYIIGENGLPIPNYSDDVTIRAQGYVTDEEIAARRKELTGNKILISLPVGASPLDHSFTATYASAGDSGVSDLQCSPSSYFEIGEITLSFDEDQPTDVSYRGRSY